MINGYPTEEELRNRIMRQLKWHNSSNTVVLIWHGYLSALFEWGVIELQIFERLSGLLPQIGSKELCELFSDEPLNPEKEREIDEFLSRRMDN